jgi:uncharacterized RDD family membrane protein YckC
MMQTAPSFYAALPDPDRQAEFYEGVTARRLTAWLFDLLIIGLLTAVAIPFTLFTALFYIPALYLFVGFIYRTVFIAGRSATPGMRLTGIEFRGSDGRRFDLGSAFLHTLGYTLSWAIAPLQLVSVILMMTNQRGQGLTDLVMGSVAIRRPA